MTVVRGEIGDNITMTIDGEIVQDDITMTVVGEIFQDNITI